MAKAFISKSKYLAGLQCAKLLWTHYNARQLLPAPDASTQAIFDQGHVVGELAQSLYPGGVEVTMDRGIDQTIKDTQALLQARKPIFEGSLNYGGVYARADVLNPVAGGKWDIIEVKSSTSVKDVNVADLAVQRYCYEGAGLKIRRCYLMHINRDYVRKGDIDASKLLIAEDVTGIVDERMQEVASEITAMQRTIAKKACPAVDIGPHCSDPYDCPMTSLCWAHVQKHERNVFTLPRIGGKAWDLYKTGVIANSEIPSAFSLGSNQAIQVEAERTETRHVEPVNIAEFLGGLKFPLYLLDFETFQAAIPMLENSKPYQQLPFQFSLHVAADMKAKPKHHAWLWDGDGDPRQLMLAELKRLIGPRGSIVSYNAVFEKGIMKTAVESVKSMKPWLKKINSRVVDLLVPFRKFWVYDPSQLGSASMKVVLPALTGKSYSDMEISDGGMASREFLRVMFTDVDPEERRRVRSDLEAYCGLDTLGMLDILQALSSMAGRRPR
ncbi:MAG: DUF2779 domain-containing protein [Verrucomicrobia bacterium]|nr:DUF2779 domain-containing protein [Verrucomicrobiota bacterium]MDA1088634.1 DUF2779 domain-containing protein [Verrucomicrobiota bacterium]